MGRKRVYVALTSRRWIKSPMFATWRYLSLADARRWSAHLEEGGIQQIATSWGEQGPLFEMETRSQITGDRGGEEDRKAADDPAI
jgi:hypothetical protein